MPFITFNWRECQPQPQSVGIKGNGNSHPFDSARIDKNKYLAKQDKGKKRTHSTCPRARISRYSDQRIKERRNTHQQPVRDRGGRRMRGGAIESDLASSTNRSSFGAMIGNRNGGLPETLLRRFCITRLTVMRLVDISIDLPKKGQGTYKKY